MKISEHTLQYDEQALNFNGALPLGNGRIGAMVYGGINEEKISLNEDSLWTGYPKERLVEDYPAVYARATELFDEGKIAEAQKLLEDQFGDFVVQMYQPLADLKIRLQHKSNEPVKRYSRMLKLDSALQSVTYRIADKTYKREYLVSEPHQVLTVKFSCNEGKSINFDVALEGRLKCECYLEQNMVFVQGAAANFDKQYGYVNKSIETQVYDEKGIHYIGGVCVKLQGGSLDCQNDILQVRDADEAVIYFAARTNFVSFDAFPAGEEYREQCRSDLLRAAETDYEVLKRQHIRSHRKLYNRCSISIAEHPQHTLLFNYGKYLTIAGSRKGTQPLNLQGIWNDKIIPPWSSNYTLNINMEMNYWPTLSMGLFECYEPFVRFVEELAQSGKETAELYYGVKEGWVCHHSSDIWRLTHPGTNRLPKMALWGFWNMASGWLSIMLWNYYRYTEDYAYLERIFPVMEGAARFYKEMLVECDGKLILFPSTSPENQYIKNGSVHAIDKSVAMTQEILYDLFGVVSKAAAILNRRDDYGELICKLRRPFIQSDGQLCEWHEEHEVWEVHHRHVSHLYGLFPSNQFAGDAAVLEACRKVLESRGDGGTGWSLAWKINLWARLGDGEHALRLVNNQLRTVPEVEEGRNTGGGSYPNMFCAHPPFQIDGNFGAANGIIEMLVQCDKNGEPILLPALPKEWQRGSVKNLRLPGNRSISFEWNKGKIVWFDIKEDKK